MSKTKPTTVRCIGYIRVSDIKQADEKRTSFADQEAAIVARAARDGLEVDLWFKDIKTGSAVEERKDFSRMIGWCKANPRPRRDPGLIIPLNDSRFGRFDDPDQQAAIRFDLKTFGWNVWFAENDDVEDPGYRSVIRTIGAVQATEYRKNLRANTRRGMKGAASQGYWTRKEPFGFRRRVVYPESAARTLNPGERKQPLEKVKLELFDREARIVLQAFERYAQGTESLQSIVRWLRKVAPDHMWSKPAANRMLRNPAYIGDVVGGRRPCGREERMMMAQRPQSEWYGKRDAHTPIVSRSLFAAVQDRLDGNRGRGPRIYKVCYLVSGIMRCTWCGEVYTGGGGSLKLGRMNERNSIYICKGHSLGKCPGRMGTIMQHIVDERVVVTIGDMLQAPAARKSIGQAVDDVLNELQRGRPDTLRSLNAQLAENAEARERLVQALARGTLREREAEATMKQLRKEEDELVTQRDRFKLEDRSTKGDLNKKALLDRALDFKASAAKLEGPRLRELIRPWLEALTFDKARRILTLRLNPIPGFVLGQRHTGTPKRSATKNDSPFVRTLDLTQPGHEQAAQAKLREIERAAGRRAGAGR